MARKKQQPAKDDDSELFDDEGASTTGDQEGDEPDELAGLEKEFDSVLADGVDDDIPACAYSGNAASRRLATKRRLDAYLERKWFRENGWDDDDDLFNDEFFDIDEIRLSQHR